MARKKHHNPFMLTVLSWLIANYIRLVNLTLRWEYIGEAHHKKLIADGKPFIVACWHGRLLMVPYLNRKHNLPTVAMMSENKDGEIMVNVVRHFNVKAVRGSSNNPRKKDKKKGGIKALKALIRAAKSGHIIGMTPDGPRGPRHYAKAGTVQIARVTGLPVVAVSFSTKHSKVFNNWDKFMLPFPVPFGKAAIVISEPIICSSKDATGMEQDRLKIERALTEVEIQADLHVGLLSIDEASKMRTEASA